MNATGGTLAQRRRASVYSRRSGPLMTRLRWSNPVASPGWGSAAMAIRTDGAARGGKRQQCH